MYLGMYFDFKPNPTLYSSPCCFLSSFLGPSASVLHIQASQDTLLLIILPFSLIAYRFNHSKQQLPLH